MNCFFYFVVLCRRSGRGCTYGVWLAAGHLSDREVRVWGRRKNSLHPEGRWLQGSCGNQSCVPLPGFGAWGRIFAKFEESSQLCRLHVYTVTHITTYGLSGCCLQLVLLQLSLNTPSCRGCCYCHRPPLCCSVPSHSLREPHCLRQN